MANIGILLQVLYNYVIHVYNGTYSKANKIINEMIEKDGRDSVREKWESVRERERESEKEREREGGSIK